MTILLLLKAKVKGDARSDRLLVKGNLWHDRRGRFARSPGGDGERGGGGSDHRTFLMGPPVAATSGEDAPQGAKTRDLVDWAAKLFQASGPVIHPSLGAVQLDRRAAADSLSHGYGRAKVQAMVLLPAALPLMRILAQESRGPGEVGYVLAAPVAIADNRYVMAALIRANDSRTRLYVHECVLVEALQEGRQYAARAGSPGELDTGNPGAIRKVLLQALRIKP